MRLFILLAAIFFISHCSKPVFKKSFETSQNLQERIYTNNSFINITLQDSLSLSADFSLKGLPFGKFLNHNNSLIFTTHNGYLYTYDVLSENAESVHLADGITTVSAYYNNYLYIPVEKGKYGLLRYDFSNAETEELLHMNHSKSRPIIFDEIIIHFALNGDIIALNNQNFDDQWTFSLNEKILNNPASLNQMIIVAGQNGSIVNINLNSGTLNWKQKLSDNFYSDPVISANYLYLAGYSGRIYKLDLINGDLLAKYESNIHIYSTVSIDEKNLYAVCSNGDLIVLNNSDFGFKKKRKFNIPAYNAPLILKDEIIIATMDKKVHRIDKNSLDTKQLFNIKGRPKIQPAVLNQKLLIGHEPDMLVIYE